MKTGFPNYDWWRKTDQVTPPPMTQTPMPFRINPTEDGCRARRDCGKLFRDEGFDRLLNFARAASHADIITWHAYPLRMSSAKAHGDFQTDPLPNFQIDPPPSVKDLPRLLLLAGCHQLTAYDAAWLDLAIRLSLPLATGEGDLRKAAATESVELLAQ